MIQKPLDQIERADILDLVHNAVSERRDLDYKQELPGTSDGAKKEFLADISAFANASGGDLLYGISEERDENGKPTGIPDGICGLGGENLDAQMLRLENIIRDGIAPRIPVQIRPINGFPEGDVLLIRIPNSWAAPHMVIFKSTSRFFTRNSAGKYPLDVHEIRNAFAASEAAINRIQQFRDGRLAKIIANETPVTLLDNPKIVLHLIPIASLNRTIPTDIATSVKQFGNVLEPIFSRGFSGRYNLDGYLTYSGSQSNNYESYLQIFRTGSIESVDSHALGRSYNEQTIPSLLFEREVIHAVTNYLKLLEQLNLSPPFFVMVCLISVKGFKLAANRQWGHREFPIDRDILILPEIIIENFQATPANELQALFDALWQSAGFEASENYDPDGIWDPDWRRNRNR